MKMNPKNCVMCGVEFLPRNGRQLTCSEGCAQERYKQTMDRWFNDDDTYNFNDNELYFSDSIKNDKM